jgi:hypothetical protein
VAAGDPVSTAASRRLLVLGRLTSESRADCLCKVRSNVRRRPDELSGEQVSDECARPDEHDPSVRVAQMPPIPVSRTSPATRSKWKA